MAQTDPISEITETGKAYGSSCPLSQQGRLASCRGSMNTLVTAVVFWVRTIAGSRNGVHHMAFPSFFHFRNQEPLLRALETEVNSRNSFGRTEVVPRCGGFLSACLSRELYGPPVTARAIISLTGKDNRQRNNDNNRRGQRWPPAERWPLGKSGSPSRAPRGAERGEYL